MTIINKPALKFFLAFLGFIPDFVGQSSYKEDLSSLRCNFPEIEFQEVTISKNPSKESTTEIIAEYHVTDIINQILEKKKELKSRMDRVKCYTIQVYLGTNRLLAFSIFEKIHSLFQDASVQYSETNYIVRIGKHIDKLELLDKYAQIIKIFPNITVRPIFVPKTEVFLNIEAIAPVVDDTEGAQCYPRE